MVPGLAPAIHPGTVQFLRIFDVDERIEILDDRPGVAEKSASMSRGYAQQRPPPSPWEKRFAQAVMRDPDALKAIDHNLHLAGQAPEEDGGGENEGIAGLDLPIDDPHIVVDDR
jgi:hypothetical protein